MALSLGTQFLLFLWFSGVNHFVNPSSEAGSGGGMEPDYQNEQELLAMEDRYSYMHRFRFAVPPSHVDPIQEPIRRQYRLEDFLWTGSGDGPNPSEMDGGLAWEDNGGAPVPGTIPGSPEQSRSWIQVTKTVTIYRTALTTIYPVEMTPAVVSGMPPLVQPTPQISDSPVSSGSASFPDVESSYYSSGVLVPSDNVMWIPTPTFSPTPPEPTIMPSSTVSTEVMTTASVHPTLSPQEGYSSETTDISYWIQTSIKANDTAFKDRPDVFQNSMQKRLARVYAYAFKRHLLSTLGVLSSSLSPTKTPNQARKRRKRWTDYLLENDGGGRNDPGPLHLWPYVAQSSISPSQLMHLATTSMNVTVTILNVTEDKKEKGDVSRKVDLTYIVLAEGTPVPAFSAVKELDLVSKEEMEREIGYEIIDKKAEALVAGPPEQMTRNEQSASTSAWLIVAVTTICLLVILLTLIAFMVWKWKHNRLGDSNNRRVPPAARPQSGIIEIEEGVINPAFLGTPSRTGHGESHEQSPKSSPALSLLSARARHSAKKISEAISRQRSSFRQRRKDGAHERDSAEKGERRKRKPKDRTVDSPTSSEELRLHKKPTTTANLTSSEGSAEWKELLGEPKPKVPGGRGGRSPQKSPQRSKRVVPKRTPNTGRETESKDSQQRRRRRKTQVSKIEDVSWKSDEDSEISQFSDIEELDRGVSPKSSSESQRKQQPWLRGMTDAISLGNLDICQDSIAQTPSEYAKKLVPWKRPGSAVGAQGSTGGGAKGHHYHIGQGGPSGSSLDTFSRRPGSRLALPETIEEIPSYDLTEEEDEEQDRDLSEKSFEMKDSPRKTPGAVGSPPDTKDAQVQTPTRISKTTSHKARAAPKPRKSWRGSPGQSESVISTESEEIVEVHHINSSMSDDQNPLGRMRKRFHQFLDDAFNVMVSGGNKREDAETKAETQSAKVSICHEVVEKETEWRPWTSHVIREESLQKLRRPKSAAVPIGPPKRAWTASSERRTSSAKVKAQPGSSVAPSGNTSRQGSAPFQGSSRPLRQMALDDEDSKTSTPCAVTQEDSTVSRTLAGTSTSDQSHSSVILTPAFIFPQYPTYPDIRVNSRQDESPSSTNPSSIQSQPQPGTSSSQSKPPLPTLPSNDPAVPLIQAIKNEMKRFEKDPSPGSQ